MRALVISQGMPSDKYPMAGIFEYDQAKALSSLGIDVTYFAIDLRSVRRIRKWGVSKGVKDGIKWYSMSIPVGAIPLTWLCLIGRYAVLYLYKKVYRQAIPPHIIHAHFTVPGYFGAYLSKKIKVPLVVTEHSSEMNKKEIAGNLKRIAYEAYNQASQLICVSRGLANNIKRQVGIDSLVIWNIVDIDLFYNRKAKEHNGFHIMTMSNLVPIKRTYALIDAFVELHKQYGDFYLDVVGDGPMKNNLETQVYNHKVEKYVKFYGYMSREEALSVYEHADCFALVSEKETFGVVLIEAMAAGLPVIATRCGGPEDFVTKETGILVDVDDIKQITEAILFIRRNKGYYDADAIRKYSRDNFSPQSIARKIINVYKSVIEIE